MGAFRLRVLLVMVYVATAVLVAVVGFYPVMILAGPHSDILPEPLQSGLIGLYWLSVFIVPLFAVPWVKKKLAKRAIQSENLES